MHYSFYPGMKTDMQTASGYSADVWSFSSGAELPVGAELWVYWMQELLLLLFAAGLRSSCPLWALTRRDLLWVWSLTPVRPHYVNECEKKRRGVKQLLSKRVCLVLHFDMFLFFFLLWNKTRGSHKRNVTSGCNFWSTWSVCCVFDEILLYVPTVLEQANGMEGNTEGPVAQLLPHLVFLSVLKGNQIPPSAAHPTSHF